MRHAILGAGGVGLLVGGALARAGRDVLLLLRPQTLTAFPGRIAVESAALGDFEAAARAAARLEEPVDVLWVTPKATALEAALALAPPEHVALAVPLLNGLDHVPRLRERYPRVVAGTISVESERVGPGRARQTSPFVRVALAPGGEEVAAELRAAGLPDVELGESEAAVLWAKLSFLAPLALATTAAAAPVGAIRDDPRFVRCRAEVRAVSAAEGAPQDASRQDAQLAAATPEMRTSMQKDVAAGRPTELDAIGGAVLRAAARHGMEVPATRELVEAVARLAPSARP